MRLVIDMQGAQTESRFRGIGRYTMEFTQAVVRNRGEHEVILVLNGLLPNSIEPIRAAFDGLLPQENIRVWYALGPVKEEHSGNETRREVAELIREAFIASLKPDIVHITSLFEGYVDCAVTSIGSFDSDAKVSVTLYDLIPLLNSEQYLQPNPFYEDHYKRKIHWLKNASVMLGISEYASQEIKDTLKTEAKKVVTISTAIESHFKKLDIDQYSASAILCKFGVRKQFVLYTGGADDRKNLPRLIKAYAKLSYGVRKQHQLVFAGRMQDSEIKRFNNVANQVGLDSDELIFTGYINESDLVAFYNLCKLYVFPSWHEGFGLPALEAMACGAPVVGANTTSLPEVLGCNDAMFDPFNVDAITDKIQAALIDENFRQNLIKHAEKQVKKFSWNTTAKTAINAWENLLNYLEETSGINNFNKKTKLAYVSPVPPEKTGIADYSAELLPALSNYYEIILILDQVDIVSTLSNDSKYSIKDVTWLLENRDSVDRVVYQVGNSPYHKHMLQLVKEVPGTVVLHDFYASGLMAWLENSGISHEVWNNALYRGHGYNALKDKHNDAEEAKRLYPVSWNFVEHAHGVIFHSVYAKSLLSHWYGLALDKSTVIPLLREPATFYPKRKARSELDIPTDAFVICSFGFLAPTKLNHRLLDSFLLSKLAKSERVYLIFVGQNHGGDYGENILSTIKGSNISERIRITGFTEAVDFKKYLSIADLAVQLRTDSRGETSASVLDCMNYGVPLIVNANGSMAELDEHAVLKLPDEFCDTQLTHAIELLFKNEKRRQQMSENSRFIIQNSHAPEKCAALYFQAIEKYFHRNKHELPKLLQRVGMLDNIEKLPRDQLSELLDQNFPAPQPVMRLFIDVTATCSNDLKTGIERMTRALTSELIKLSTQGFRVEPVYLSKVNGRWRYVYARNYIKSLLEIDTAFLVDEVVDFAPGDIVMGLDNSGGSLVESVSSGYQNALRQLGVKFYYMVFDLLPIRMPEVFPKGADKTHLDWLKAISSLDGVIAISKHVADDINLWLEETDFHSSRERPFLIDFIHLGADIDSSSPSKGLPADSSKVIDKIKNIPSFLMVGTIEPRKGHAFALGAFEKLWTEGYDINLVIVGKEGWVGLGDEMRRDIPSTMNRLRNHPEKNKRLFFLEDVSDEYLNKIYQSCICLISASYDEGFGLPLIEAAQHKIPIIARDIAVFREVVDDHAFYFNGEESESLAVAIQHWLELYKRGKHPQSGNMPWLTWQQSAETLKDIILKSKALTRFPRSRELGYPDK